MECITVSTLMSVLLGKRVEEVGGFAGSAGSAGSLRAQCGDGLDALLLLLHALYLPGIRST